MTTTCTRWPLRVQVILPILKYLTTTGVKQYWLASSRILLAIVQNSNSIFWEFRDLPYGERLWTLRKKAISWCGNILFGPMICLPPFFLICFICFVNKNDLGELLPCHTKICCVFCGSKKIIIFSLFVELDHYVYIFGSQVSDSCYYTIAIIFHMLILKN